jgi:hypothetical protein
VPGVTSALEVMEHKVCFMLKPKQYQSSKIRKQNDKAKIKKRPLFPF